MGLVQAPIPEGMKNPDSVYLYEIFTSIQGEGLWIGSLHLFLRLAGCTAGCRYCDTPQAFIRPERYQVMGRTAGLNPVGIRETLELLRNLDVQRPGARALAITGGEPLLQASCLSRLIPEMRKEWLKGRPVLLETGGLNPDEMALLAGKVDMVSMDIKLRSTSGLMDTLDLHRRFLEVLSTTPVYVKTVVDSHTPVEEIAQAASLVAEKDPAIPFILQPATREGRIAAGEYLLDLLRTASDSLEDVRILPQIHGILDLK